ncbi:MAG: DUF58 domain-containing protein [Halopseudomonas sp.]
MASLLGGWLAKSPVRQKFRQWSEAWLRSRLPRTRSATLNQRRIFILPTRNGLYFLVMAVVLFLGGLNYGNSLILLTSVLLVSLFLVSILHTYVNLSGLTLAAGRTQPTFAGQEAAFGVRLSSGGREHESLQLSWPGAAPQRFDLVDAVNRDISLLLPVSRRGLCRPPRLKVQSCYPLGLLRVWSWVELDTLCLVYPKPEEASYPLREAQSGERGERLQHEGNDDFDGLRRYQLGDNPRRIAWKSYAREGRLYSKVFASYCADEHWLEWEAYSGLAQEQRLSRLCYWVLQLDQQQHRFGLRLPGIEFAPDSGGQHRQRCLKALGLYGLDLEHDDTPASTPAAELSS